MKKNIEEKPPNFGVFAYIKYISKYLKVNRPGHLYYNYHSSDTFED